MPVFVFILAVTVGVGKYVFNEKLQLLISAVNENVPYIMTQQYGPSTVPLSINGADNMHPILIHSVRWRGFVQVRYGTSEGPGLAFRGQHRSDGSKTRYRIYCSLINL